MAIYEGAGGGGNWRTSKKGGASITSDPLGILSGGNRSNTLKYNSGVTYDFGTGETGYDWKNGSVKPSTSGTTTPTTTGGSSGRTGSGGSSSAQVQVAPGNPYGALLAQYEDSYARAIAAYDAAYNTAIGNIGNAYNVAAGSARGNLDQTRGLIGDSYNRSHGEVTRDAERALREAYINHMMSRRDLQQSLSAQGLNGGASESTLASMTNNYGNTRFGIEENKATNLTNLVALRDENLAKALMAYNSEMASLEQNRASQLNAAEMSRASQIAAAEQARAQLTAQIAMANVNYLNEAGYPTIGSLNGFTGVSQFAPAAQYSVQPMAVSSGYQSGLSNLANAMNDYNWNVSEVGNAPTPVSTQQAVNMSGSDYAKYLAQLELMAGAQRRSNLGAAIVPTGYGNNGYQMTIR